MPRPVVPANIIDFHRKFASEEACYEFVRDSRWPDGFVCPRCGNRDAYDIASRRQIRCTLCKGTMSVTAGTVMHSTKLPLCAWMTAAWLMVSSKGGHSALELARQIGVHQETAFVMLHKLRHAMVAPEREQLRGRVAVDESYIGGPSHGGPRGRGALGKSIIVGAVEAGPARVRFRVVPDTGAATLRRFIEDNVESGSTIVTDGHKGYSSLPGYRHVTAASTSDALRDYHTAVGNLKAWLLGTHHGAVEAKHLQAYLNEFVFRYNRRGNLASAFRTLLGLVPAVGVFRQSDIYADAPMHRNPSRRRR